MKMDMEALKYELEYSRSTFEEKAQRVIALMREKADNLERRLAQAKADGYGEKEENFLWGDETDVAGEFVQAVTYVANNSRPDLLIKYSARALSVRRMMAQLTTE